jgi:hypothetical protein
MIYCTFMTSCSSRVTLETSSRATLAGRHAAARTNGPNEQLSVTLRKQYKKALVSLEVRVQLVHLAESPTAVHTRVSASDNNASTFDVP